MKQKPWGCVRMFQSNDFHFIHNFIFSFLFVRIQDHRKHTLTHTEKKLCGRLVNQMKGVIESTIRIQIVNKLNYKQKNEHDSNRYLN